MDIKSHINKKPIPKDEKLAFGYQLGTSIRKKVEKRFLETGNKLNSWQELVGNKTTSGIVITIWFLSFCYFLYSLLTVIIK